MASRIRIDRLLVERGLAETREKAAKLILAGDVFVDGERVDKAGALITPEAEVELRGRSPYVSRGGEKLAHALDHFAFNVLAPRGEVVALIKPQFEVGKELVGKGGVVRDPALHQQVVARLARYTVLRGWHIFGVSASPLRGPKGNREFFLHLSSHGKTAANVETLISRAVEALA